MAPVEVIDLSLSSPEQNKSSSNDKRAAQSLPSPSEPSSHKRRAKRKRTSTSNDGNAHRAEYNDDKDELFFVDLTPGGLPSTSQAAIPAGQQEILLLPLHVTVLAGSSGDLDVQPLSDLEDDDFIKYVDYEDAKGVVRYFHQSSDETTSVVRIVCKNCGAEGLHKTSACRVQICLTCGARDEHSTRSCPISKVCFSCGMKGHINANCPNRRTSRALLSEHRCNRCSASTHKTNECPTWWRLYDYFGGQDRDRVLAMRRQKREMKLGDGGEGYIADDEWCYNCGNAGHWGDNCDAFKHTFEFGEHSAFSKANVMKGPFYVSSNNHRPIPTKPRARDWEKVDKVSELADVGRKGRLKSKVALERQAMELEHHYNEDDWFANGSRPKNRPTIRSSHAHVSSNSLSFDRQNDRYAPERRPGPPSLLERIQMQPPARQNSESIRRPYPRDPRFDRTKFEDRNRHPSDRRDYGPRYKGGYGK